MGALAFAHQCQTPGVHHVAQMIAVVLDPFEHHGLGFGSLERGESAQHADEFGQDGGSLLLPAFAYILLGIGVGSGEEEAGLVPEIGHKVDAPLHETHHAGDVFVAEVGRIHAVGFKHGAEQLGQTLVGGVLKIFVVKPAAFLVGKLGSGARAVVEGEFADKLVHRHDFGVIAGAPSEQREKVDYRLGQIARLAIAGRHGTRRGVVPFERKHREAQTVAVALGELALAVGLEQQRQVHEVGACVGPSEGLVEKHMERSRGEPLLAAYHVGDLHQMVVHDIGEVIGGQVVGTLVEHLVVEYRRVDGHLAAEQVVDHHVASRLDEEAHHIGGAAIHQSLHLLGGHGERVAHRQACRGVILEVGSGRAGGVKLGGGVKGDICLAGVEKHLHVLAIDVATLALLVGAIGSALAHTFVNLYAKPCERLVDIVLGSGHKTLRVGVLDAEYHVTAVTAGEKIVIKGSAHSSDMKGACGRGGKSYSDFTVHQYLIYKILATKLAKKHGITVMSG